MSKKLYVGNLAFTVEDQDLREAFDEFGAIVSASVVTERETGRSRGFGFVEMDEGADEAIEALNGQDLKGRKIVVNEARARTDRGPRQGGGSRGGQGRRY